MPAFPKTSQINIADLTGTEAKSKQGREAISRLKKAHDADFALCARDFWYWCTNVRTFDEENRKVRPFPLDYGYLRDFNKQIEEHQKTIVLKSRRMLVSWLGALRQLHQAMFCGSGLAGTADSFRGGIMSVGETEAEHLMERIYFVYDGLPEWMRIRSPLDKNNNLYARFRNGGAIQAFPLKREGPRTFGFSEVLFDEMAFQEAARTVWMGLTPTLGAKGKIVAVSTPNGRGNLYADVYFNREDRFPGMHKIKMHWTANPEHDEKWYKAATHGMDKQMIAREFELSFAAYYGKPVWDSWDRRMHIVEETPIDQNRPVLIGWDLGYHYPAMTLWQKNHKDQFVGIAELQGYDRSFDNFCEQVKQVLESHYDRRKVKEIHFTPPDARIAYRTRGRSGANNDCDQIMRTFGIGGQRAQIRISPGEVGTRANEAPRLKEFRKALAIRADTEPGLFVNDRMELFIEGCQGGYCYDEPRRGQVSEEPSKNESSHLQDSAQAVVAGYAMMNRFVDKKPTESRKRPRIGQRTGI